MKYKRVKNPLSIIASSLLVLTGCTAAPPTLGTVPDVDISRFMGDWYVIASIPTFLKKRRTTR